MKRTVTIMSVADLELYHTPGFGREGSSSGKAFPLDTGVPGLILEFSWRHYDKGYGTPRHKHIFDQYRYNLGGKRMIKDGYLEEGEVGFYPEGVSYGPQMQEEPCYGLGLQFQGLSGIPYLTHAQLRAARNALLAEGGTFKDGIYTKILPNGRKINKDLPTDRLAAIMATSPARRSSFPKASVRKADRDEAGGVPVLDRRRARSRAVDHRRLPGTFGNRACG